MTIHSDDETDHRSQADAICVVPVDPDEPIAMAVVNAVADTLECSPLELAPLSSQIDPDALESLMNAPVGRRNRLTVSFSFAGFDVAVTRSQVRLQPTPDRNDI